MIKLTIDEQPLQSAFPTKKKHNLKVAFCAGSNAVKRCCQVKWSLKTSCKIAIYPPLSDINKVLLAIAVAVAEKAWEQGLARETRPAKLEL